MADAISGIASVQLGMLQAPEVAREQSPATMQAQLANAQAGAVIAKWDQDALETVQRLQSADSRGVPDSLSGHANRDSPAYRQRPSRRPKRVVERTIPLAASHPRSLGALVDVRA